MPATLEQLHPVLAAFDPPASRRFYESLGFVLLFQDATEAPQYLVLRRDAVELHLQWTDAADLDPAADRPVYRFLVSDVDALYVEFAACGLAETPDAAASPWARPVDTPWGTREFHLRDPSRNGLQFYRPR